MDPSKEIYDTLGTNRPDRRSHRRQRAASTPPHHPYARPQQNIRPSNAPMPTLSQILYGRGLPRGAGSSYTRGQGTSSHTTGQPTLPCSTTVHVPPGSPIGYIESANLNRQHLHPAVLQQLLMPYTEEYLSRSHLRNPRRDNIHADQWQASNAYRSRSCDPSPRRYNERANLDRRHPLPAESQQALLWHTDDLTSSRAHLQNPRVNNIHADQRQASSADWSNEPSSRRYIERENLNSRDQLYAELQPALVQRIDELASAVAQLQNRGPDNRYADQRQDYNALSAADWAREAREQQGLPDASIDPRRPDALLAVYMQAHRAIHPTVGPAGETIARTPAWYEQQGRRSDEIIQADQRRTWNMDVPLEYWTDPGALCVYCGGAVWGQDLDFDTRQCGHYQHRACHDRYNNGAACRACAAGIRVFPFEF